MLQQINKHIEKDWLTEMPTVPHDDVCEKLSSEQKGNFVDNLKEFIEGAEKALESDNQLEASKIWRKYLGKRFPKGADEDVDAKEAKLKATSASILSGAAKTDKKGNVQKNEGIVHKKHKNYGG